MSYVIVCFCTCTVVRLHGWLNDLTPAQRYMLIAAYICTKNENKSGKKRRKNTRLSSSVTGGSGQGEGEEIDGKSQLQAIKVANSFVLERLIAEVSCPCDSIMM